MATLSTTKKTVSVRQRPPRVGDRAFINMGNELEGTIVEERGNIGVGGRPLYRITVDMGEGVPLHVELPASEFRWFPQENIPRQRKKHLSDTLLLK